MARFLDGATWAGVVVLCFVAAFLIIPVAHLLAAVTGRRS